MEPTSGIDHGDTAWMLVATALVLLMTPGLALFYGGMVRRKNVLGTLMHSFFAMGLVSIQWVAVGYSLAFGRDHSGIVGGLEMALLNGVNGARGTIPHLVFVAYQGMFAVITPALIAGAFAERIKFSGYVLFTLLWATLVYDPVAHWVWAEGGWLYRAGALDFAGGTVVHLISGVSALVLARAIGPRIGFGRDKLIPHDVPMTVLGAGLLLFGWIGFNAGSALGANETAGLALTTTWIAASGGALSWSAAEWWKHGKPSTLGTVSGLVAGLVGITPAAGFVGPGPALAIGAAAGLVCWLAVMAKGRLGYDDSLDAFGIHGVGGLLGALLTGVFASKAWNAAGQDGLLRGNAAQLGTQGIGVVACGLYAAVATAAIVVVVKATVGLRVDEADEREGLDTTQHGEEAYNP
ncbi:MAG: ammonium transporter [Deltaproteobacteria bacterium]|nr:ammonium transporter [Deltaproteobacteria bacterium]